MQIHKATGRQAHFIVGALSLILYLGISTVVGFPLGFGKLMAWGVAQDNCQVVSPQASLGKTVFNPVDNAFSSDVYVGEETCTIYTNPNRDTVGDRHRSDAFLQDTGAAEVISKLFRTHVSGKSQNFLSCSIVWDYADPMTPITHLRIDYTDYDNPALPNEAQMKSILTPIALDCITAVEECFSLDSIRLSYYHPNFHPDEEGMTWRIMEVLLVDGAPRTKDLLDDAIVNIS
ncbi:hypothetical protein [Oscillibacter sp.]|uniref:hypothetical protein n=1 Tax=Oscillibacter sp. TaxID=1945593 RepID=UPI0028A26BFA|nr:hypothetical protein [Oscillibacter sp.]